MTINPQGLGFHAQHVGLSATTLLDLYGPRLPAFTSYFITGMKASQRGSLAELTGEVANTKLVTSMSLKDDGDLWVVIREIDEDDGIWDVSITRGHRTASEAWLRELLPIITVAHEFPGLDSAAIERRQSSMSSFVPEPPLARANHAVLVKDADVAAAYEDPATFWKMWKVESRGPWKLCTRALGEIDEIAWLAYTFESTMALVRAAKPGLTRYGVAYWEPEMAPWWELGDLQDEKAGFPALAPGGYEEDTHTYDLIGFVTKTPLDKGGEEPRHVLVREIYDVRDLVQTKRDPAGRPVDTVRVRFLEEWMARQERRPLLDAGARVFFGDTEITD